MSERAGVGRGWEDGAMSELVEFLSARITEDEAVVKGMLEDDEAWGNPYSSGASLEFEQTFNAERILAECEAKRRIVEEHRPAMRMHDRPVRKSWRGSSFQGGVAGCSTCGDGLCPTLLALATVYADHHDYDEAWRP